MATPVVRHAGARYVVITDLNPFRLDLARKMGATLAINPTETPLQKCRSNSAWRRALMWAWKCRATGRHFAR